MAFEVVTIADRISQYPDRRRLTKEDGSSELVTVAAEEGSVSAEGTEWGAAYANDLETRIDAETQLLEGNFGTVETTTTASKAYAIGDCLVLNGQYYKVIAAISQGATLVVGTNIAVHSVSAINSKMLGIKTYVGEDKLLHFVDGTGADSALNFSSIKVRHLVTCNSSAGSGTWYWYRKLLPSPEVNICSNGTTVNNYSHPSNLNIGPILFVTRNDASGIWTLKNRLNYPLTVTPNGGTAFTVAAGAYFTNFNDNAVFTAEYVSQNLDELRDICTNIT